MYLGLILNIYLTDKPQHLFFHSKPLFHPKKPTQLLHLFLVVWIFIFRLVGLLLFDFCHDLFPNEEFHVYVPPSNIISEEGRRLLAEDFPEIRAIASLYLPDDNDVSLFFIATHGDIDEIGRSAGSLATVNEAGITDALRLEELADALSKVPGTVIVWLGL